jgi:hypothetical protein
MATEPSDAPERKDRTPLWVAIAGIVGVAIGAWINGRYNEASHQHDLNAKMIELSISILRADVQEETLPLREWAIDVMDKRANFQFNDAQRAVLLKQPLPSYGSDYYPSYDSTYQPPDKR